METSQKRILTTHVGSLPRSKAVTDVVFAMENNQQLDANNAKMGAMVNGARLASRRLWS